MTPWSEWGPVVPWIITSVSVAYVAYVHCKLRQLQRQQSKDLAFNPTGHDRKHVLRVGEHITKGGKLALCRCWRSQTFPYCDGTHKEFNSESGECLGAAVIEWCESMPDDNETKTIVEQMDIQSMNASTELSSLEMIDSNGENDSRDSRDSPQSQPEDNNLIDN